MKRLRLHQAVRREPGGARTDPHALQKSHLQTIKMPLRCALLILWAACSSGARDGDGERRSPAAAADQDRDAEITLLAAGYDPEVAARMLWWSTKAAYFKYKLEDREIGRNHLDGKVWLASNSEMTVLRDGSNAYVIFLRLSR